MGQIENSLLLDVIVEILGNPRKENLTKSQYSFDCPVCSAEKDMPDGDGKGNDEDDQSGSTDHGDAESDNNCDDNADGERKEDLGASANDDHDYGQNSVA